MNQRGDFLLYIVFTVVLLLIGAILVYVYLTPQDNNSNNGEAIDFKTQYPSKLITESVYSKEYPIKAKLVFEVPLNVSDKNVSLFGKPEIIVSERIFIVKDPVLGSFSGTLTKTGLEGNVKTITSKDTSLDLRTAISINFGTIDKLIIDDMYLDLEAPNISGTLDISGKSRALDKSYLQIKGFKGKLTILPDLDKEITTLELDGNVGYLKYIDGVEETILK